MPQPLAENDIWGGRFEKCLFYKGELVDLEDLITIEPLWKGSGA